MKYAIILICFAIGITTFLKRNVIPKSEYIIMLITVTMIITIVIIAKDKIFKKENTNKVIKKSNKSIKDIEKLEKTKDGYLMAVIRRNNNLQPIRIILEENSIKKINSEEVTASIKVIYGNEDTITSTKTFKNNIAIQFIRGYGKLKINLAAGETKYKNINEAEKIKENENQKIYYKKVIIDSQCPNTKFGEIAKSIIEKSNITTKEDLKRVRILISKNIHPDFGNSEDRNDRTDAMAWANNQLERVEKRLIAQ